MKRKNWLVLVFILLCVVILVSCGNDKASVEDMETIETVSHSVINTDADVTEKAAPYINTMFTYSANDVPEYDNQDYVTINDNVPFFTDDEITSTAFSHYSDLDSLGRCRFAVACIGKELMPTEPRGEIGEIKPTGWQLVKYDEIEGNYLYNRCHLIGYQLAGENANEKNLITGTRYFNTIGMLPFEEKVASAVKNNDIHVMYRVTPVFNNNDLLAKGVLMEGYSVEDAGDSTQFCVFVYNVQPGINIDYSNGDSCKIEKVEESTETNISTEGPNYILNKNSKKFHYPSCDSVSQMKEKNKLEFYGTRDEVIEKGYESCQNCNP